MDVILVEPCVPANQREFARALHAVGARVIGIGERPKSALDDGLRRWLTHYEQIGNVTDAGALEHAARLFGDMLVGFLRSPSRFFLPVERPAQPAALPPPQG